MNLNLLRKITDSRVFALPLMMWEASQWLCGNYLEALKLYHEMMAEWLESIGP